MEGGGTLGPTAVGESPIQNFTGIQRRSHPRPPSRSSAQASEKSVSNPGLRFRLSATPCLCFLRCSLLKLFLVRAIHKSIWFCLGSTHSTLLVQSLMDDYSVNQSTGVMCYNYNPACANACRSPHRLNVKQTRRENPLQASRSTDTCLCVLGASISNAAVWASLIDCLLGWLIHPWAGALTSTPWHDIICIIFLFRTHGYLSSCFHCFDRVHRIELRASLTDTSCLFGLLIHRLQLWLLPANNILYVPSL